MVQKPAQMSTNLAALLKVFFFQAITPSSLSLEGDPLEFNQDPRFCHICKVKMTNQGGAVAHNAGKAHAERKLQLEWTGQSRSFYNCTYSANMKSLCISNKYRRIGVPTQDSFSSRIIKVCSLSRVEAESENRTIGVELFGVESNIKLIMEY